MKQHFSLRDVARLLKLKPYQVAYAISVGKVPEPQLRVANKRIFQRDDVQRLAIHFAVSLMDEGSDTAVVESKRE